MVPENMLHLIRNTPTEIKRNHALARLRLRERKITWIDKFKSELADYFYTTETWPTYAIEFLLTKDFSYSERIGLACFFYGNGLREHDKAVRIFMVYNTAWSHNKRWSMKMHKFRCLFGYLANENELTSWNGGHIRNTYYYYDMNLKQTMYFDGHVRKRNGEKRNIIRFFTFKMINSK